MGKKYNISSKSDMRRFERDLTNKVQSLATETLQKQTYDVTCPHCQATFGAQSGRNICPSCRNNVDLNLNIKF